MSAPVVIAAGGTGGHVVPALAVADVLAARDVPVVWLGTRAGLEARLVPAAGIPVRWIDVAGLRGKGVVGALTGPARLARACVQSVTALRELRPRAVLGMGGFVSGPVGLAALVCRCPLVLHEQNAIPGMTNRRLARFATRVFSAWDDVFPAGIDARVVGNPVRGDIAALVRSGLAADRRIADGGIGGGAGGGGAGGERTGRAPLRVLVVGGSRGARALNETVPPALRALGTRVEVLHQSGADEAEAVRARYAGAAVAARVEPFVDDMARAYAEADLVVCRSGAMTVTELAALGVPSILVPFPHAVDDHQSANARRLSTRGAAVLIPQSELAAERLAAEIERLDADRAALEAMGAAARGAFVPGAAEAVADALSAAGADTDADTGANRSGDAAALHGAGGGR